MRTYGFVGSREFKDLARVETELLKIAYGDVKKDPDIPDEDYAEVADNITIVSGGARGVDKFSEFTALELGMHVRSYRPKQDEKTGLWFVQPWEDGKPGQPDGRIYSRFATAAFARNTRIVNEVEELFVFWNGVSTGTLDTKQKAHNRGIPVNLVLEEA